MKENKAIETVKTVVCAALLVSLVCLCAIHIRLREGAERRAFKVAHGVAETSVVKERICKIF